MNEPTAAQQALAFLDRIVSQVSLPREQHAQAMKSVDLIAEALAPATVPLPEEAGDGEG